MPVGPTPMPAHPPGSPHEVDVPGKEYDRLREAVDELLKAARQSKAALSRPEDYAVPDACQSAQNFAAYLGIRRTDIRNLQRSLHRIGLSSLGRIETHAVNSLESVLKILSALCGNSVLPPMMEELTYDAGEQILSRRTSALLGPKPRRRTPRIMVTMPSEAAEHYELIRDLVDAGMELMRINCAHDEADRWLAMMRHARRAAEETRKRCTILCDLAGPKLRTGPVQTGAGVVRWRAFKSAYGEIIEPARVWVSCGAAAPHYSHATLPVQSEFLEQLRAGDEIHFRDVQGRARWLVVIQIEAGGAWADGARGAFVVEGTKLTARRGCEDLPVDGSVSALPPMPREVSLKAGDLLVLTPDDVPGQPAEVNAEGVVVRPAQIGCSLPEVFRDCKQGERVFFDDGKIAGIIESVGDGRMTVRITWTRSQVARLAEEKGINLPDTGLRVPALTPRDLEALDFMQAHRDFVDVVGLSFVREADDITAFYRELDRRQLDDLGVVLKIETGNAFQQLPGIVLAALRRNVVGVMIARGDLGVEVGFERMAELQEEIASLCAAAHLPVIWATQVLETLAKKGMPSRAEVSDVVMAARTQCVMLNKGPHVVAAVKFLIDVLERMEGHQDKHFRLLRALSVARAHA